jgi:hypothetical protein
VVNDGHGVDHAMTRAAHDLGVSLRQLQPSRAELHHAIADYRELFHPDQLATLRSQRALALQAMHSLADFQPRLAGPLVHGDGPLDRVRLLLFADAPEEVLLHLHERHIPWQEAQVPLQHAGNRRRDWPAARFMAGQSRIEVVILDRQSLSDPPRDPIDGGRLDMLDSSQLAALLEG